MDSSALFGMRPCVTFGAKYIATEIDEICQVGSPLREVSMKSRPTITSIELIQFAYELKDMGREPTIGIPQYRPGSTLPVARDANHASARAVRPPEGPDSGRRRCAAREL